jgi:hypothetical protein
MASYSFLKESGLESLQYVSRTLSAENVSLKCSILGGEPEVNHHDDPGLFAPKMGVVGAFLSQVGFLIQVRPLLV